jgi:hypothetical protein
MPETRKFCKRTEEIAGEIVKVIYDFTVGSERISEVTTRLRMEMEKNARADAAYTPERKRRFVGASPHGDSPHHSVNRSPRNKGEAGCRLQTRVPPTHRSVSGGL